MCVRAGAVAIHAVGVVVLCACGTILGSDDGEAPAPPIDTPASSDAGVATDGAGPTDGAADALPPPLCSEPSTVKVSAVEDTSPGTSDCAGANTTGSNSFMNVGVGAAMIRFYLNAVESAAILQGRATGVFLVLTEDPAPGVPAVQGALAAHVMTNDWSAGTSGGTYTGADMCRRGYGNPGTGWGTSGAPASGATRIAQEVDYGPSVGAQAFADGAKVVTVLLDPKTLAAEWAKRGNGVALSLFVEETQSGKIVAASADHVSLPKPTLVIEYCP